MNQRYRQSFFGLKWLKVHAVDLLLILEKRGAESKSYWSKKRMILRKLCSSFSASWALVNSFLLAVALVV